MIIDVTQALFVYLQDIIVPPKRDLSLEQHLLHEARCDVQRTFHFAVVNLGVVTVSVWLPICGIATGQSLPVLCTVLNDSKIQFGGLVFVLTQVEVYR